MEGLPMDFYAGAITTVAVLVSRTFFWDFRRAFGGKRRAEVMSYLSASLEKAQDTHLSRQLLCT